MGLPFFLLMGKNITHPLNGMRKKGSSKTHAPHSKKDFKVSSFFGFFVGKFASFMFCWELDVETLSFCCCLLLLKLWTLYDLAGNSCDHVVILALGHFWIVELFGMVKFGQCWWLMKFVALMNEFWIEFCRHGSCENLMCRLDWTNSFLMSAGILLECVSPISWVWKFLWVWVWVWIWKIFCGVLDFYVGHGIFFFFFFFFLDVEKKKFWTWRNFFFGHEFFVRHGIFLEWVFWDRVFCGHLNDWLNIVLQNLKSWGSLQMLRGIWDILSLDVKNIINEAGFQIFFQALLNHDTHKYKDLRLLLALS